MSAERRDEPGTHDDVASDPARDDELGTDWVGEGGATPDGPATEAPEEGSGGAEDLPPTLIPNPPA